MGNVIERYYELVGPLHSGKYSHTERFEWMKEAFRLLPQMFYAIWEDRKDGLAVRRFIEGFQFGVLPYMLDCVIAHRNRQWLTKMKLHISSIPEYRRCVRDIDAAYAKIDNADRMHAYVAQNCGTLQSKIHKELSMDKEFVRSYFYFAEQFGFIRREKKGRSYAVFTV